MKQTNDSRTGLLSGSAIYTALEKAIESAPDGTALALLDVDRFQEINDSAGAAVGDNVLTTLATLLREEFAGSEENLCRVSGDEFAVVLPNSALEQAFLRLERFRERVAGAGERFALPDARPLTVTVGVAHFPRDAKDAPGLMKAADAALMSAKEQGRNRVGLPPNEEMVMKSCYYPAGTVRRLKALAERTGRKESALLREALTDLLRKHDTL